MIDFLNNMRQNGGLGMSNLMNAMRNTSRNRIGSNIGRNGIIPSAVHTNAASAISTNTVPKSPFVGNRNGPPPTIPGRAIYQARGSVPHINGNMSHYPIRNDNAPAGRYRDTSAYDFLRKYNAGSLWSNPNTGHYPTNTAPVPSGYPTPGYIPSEEKKLYYSNDGGVFSSQDQLDKYNKIKEEDKAELEHIWEEARKAHPDRFDENGNYKNSMYNRDGTIKQEYLN